MDEATIDTLANLATSTATDRGVVATITEANSRLARQLEDRSNELKEIKALLKNERAARKGQITLNPSLDNYCWTHGYKVVNSHTNQSCNSRMGKNVKPLRWTTWEEVKPTMNDV
jgi:hypothetical protein